MNEIKNMAFTRGLAVINASGAKYIIIDADGNTHTNDPTMVLAAPVEKNHKRTRKYPHKHLCNIYADALNALNPGDCWEYEAESHEFAEDLRSGATAHCTTKFGAGHCMSTIVGNQVQILRVV
jgi:hypothetical protein